MLKGKEETEKEAQTKEKAFFNGALLDCLCGGGWTREHNGVIEFQHNGYWCCATNEEVNVAKIAQRSFENHPIGKMFLAMGETQKAYYETIIIRDIEVKLKGLLDYEINKTKKKRSADLKFLALDFSKNTSNKPLINATQYFGYDMQAYNYMRISGSEEHYIIACSKKTPKYTETLLVNKGDEIYKGGEEKVYKLLCDYISIMGNTDICKRI